MFQSMLGVTIRVSPEVAMVLGVIGAGFLALFLFAGLAEWLRKKAENPSFQKGLRVVNLLPLLGGVYAASSFYFETYRYDPVHSGLQNFSLFSVILFVILWGLTATFTSWSKIRTLGAGVATIGGVALILKPLLFPLISHNGKALRLTSEIHLSFILSGLALLVLGLVLFIASRASAAPRSKASAAQAIAAQRKLQLASIRRAQPSPTANQEPIRMVVATDYSFSKIDQGMRRLGLSLEGAPDLTPPGTQEEPLGATWADQNAKITYRFDPRCSFRRLDFFGGSDPKFLRNDVLNILYMPSLEGYKLFDMFQSPDKKKVLLALLSAEALGIGKDKNFYLTSVQGLINNQDPEIAQEAQRVLASLQK